MVQAKSRPYTCMRVQAHMTNSLEHTHNCTQTMPVIARTHTTVQCMGLSTHNCTHNACDSTSTPHRTVCGPEHTIAHTTPVIARTHIVQCTGLRAHITAHTTPVIARAHIIVQCMGLSTHNRTHVSQVVNLSALFKCTSTP